MAVSTQEQQINNRPVLMVRFRSTVDLDDVAHASGMIADFARRQAERSYVLIDVSQIELLSLSIIPVIEQRCAGSVLRSPHKPKLMLVSGEGEAQTYIDLHRLEQRSALLPVVVNLAQAKSLVGLLAGRDARTRSGANTQTQASIA